MTTQQSTALQAGATISRRTLLAAGGGAAAFTLVARGGWGLVAAAAAGEATPVTCTLATEMTEGPYYIEGMPVRQDVTEGRPGLPLELRVTVLDATGCTPLPDAAVEIWHTDAEGYYSGIAGENPGGGSSSAGSDNATTTFMRGIQVTGKDGIATIRTIFPGWYEGRTVHIHVKVHTGGLAVDDAPYAGGTTRYTGQFFFDEGLTAEVMALDAYARADPNRRTTNDEDRIYASGGEEGGLLVTTTGDLEKGLVGTVTLAIDPENVSSQGMGR